jgi:DNA-binding LacI/PurR family transcriptional regulator
VAKGMYGKLASGLQSFDNIRMQSKSRTVSAGRGRFGWQNHMQRVLGPTPDPKGASASRRRKDAVTMKDVARAAGVSQSTVSRILNDAPLRIPVSPETRERVRAAALELGYRPHPFARALRGAPTMLLGAVVRDITDIFFGTAIEALSTEARNRGYSVVLGHAGQRADEALALTAVLEARQCDAIVLLGDFTDEPRLIRDVRAAPMPVVALWHGSHLDGFPTVTVDNAFGIRSVLGHLVDLGHERIAFVGGESLGDIRERQAAYEEFLAERGIRTPKRYIRHVSNTTAGGEEAFRALLGLPKPPTAIVAATDVLAIGVVYAAYSNGLSIPDDLSVTGFDDIPLATATYPGLTTVRMPVAAMVAAAMELAVGPDGGDDDTTAAGCSFQPELIVRHSTGLVRRP